MPGIACYPKLEFELGLPGAERIESRGQTMPRKSRKVSKREVIEIRTGSPCVRDEALSEAIGYDALVLPSQQVLLVFDNGAGRLWDSKDAIHKILSKPVPAPTHVLKGRMTLGREFIEAIPRLVERLASRLAIERSRLDFSRESLKIVDDHVFRVVGRRRVLADSELFQALLAYVGEYVRLRIDGKWQVEKEEDNVWVPWIVDKEGNRRDTAMYVFEELHEPDAARSFFYSAP
jgi:hypothetical protein